MGIYVSKRNRRHTNNKGNRQIKSGSTYAQVKKIARKLGIPFGKPRAKPKK